MFDAVGLILENLSQESSSEEELVESLLSRGFALCDIESAFKWLAHIAFPQRKKTARPESMRVLTGYEKTKISAEAWGIILKLKKLNILDDHLLEEIIEKALATSSEEVDAQEMKIIIQSSITHVGSEGKKMSPSHLLYH